MNYEADYINDPAVNVLPPSPPTRQLHDGHVCDKTVTTDNDLIVACSQCGTEYA